ncbi:hypothetical protein ACFV6E_07315 [Streptomyces sp. NPDC059785]|uniref:hypothetical protein n=1 Tax=unclassified Streptomyces TaxID=2593676 RepID=UPI003663B699
MLRPAGAVAATWTAPILGVADTAVYAVVGPRSVGFRQLVLSTLVTSASRNADAYEVAVRGCRSWDARVLSEVFGPELL